MIRLNSSVEFCVNQLYDEYGLDEAQVLNIYLFGSHVYKTATEKSDVDFLVVTKPNYIPIAKESFYVLEETFMISSYKQYKRLVVTDDPQDKGLISIRLYDVRVFIDCLREHSILYVYCVFLPKEYVWKEVIQFDFKEGGKAEFDEEVKTKQRKESLLDDQMNINWGQLAANGTAKLKMVIPFRVRMVRNAILEEANRTWNKVRNMYQRDKNSVKARKLLVYTFRYIHWGIEMIQKQSIEQFDWGNQYHWELFPLKRKRAVTGEEGGSEPAAEDLQKEDLLQSFEYVKEKYEGPFQQFKMQFNALAFSRYPSVGEELEIENTGTTISSGEPAVTEACCVGKFRKHLPKYLKNQMITISSATAKSGVEYAKPISPFMHDILMSAHDVEEAVKNLQAFLWYYYSSEKLKCFERLQRDFSIRAVYYDETGNVTGLNSNNLRMIQLFVDYNESPIQYDMIRLCQGIMLDIAQNFEVLFVPPLNILNAIQIENYERLDEIILQPLLCTTPAPPATKQTKKRNKTNTASEEMETLLGTLEGRSIRCRLEKSSRIHGVRHELRAIQMATILFCGKWITFPFGIIDQHTLSTYWRPYMVFLNDGIHVDMLQEEIQSMQQTFDALWHQNGWRSKSETSTQHLNYQLLFEMEYQQGHETAGVLRLYDVLRNYEGTTLMVKAHAAERSIISQNLGIHKQPSADQMITFIHDPKNSKHSSSRLAQALFKLIAFEERLLIDSSQSLWITVEEASGSSMDYICSVSLKSQTIVENNFVQLLHDTEYCCYEAEGKLPLEAQQYLSEFILSTTLSRSQQSHEIDLEILQAKFRDFLQRSYLSSHKNWNRTRTLLSQMLADIGSVFLSNLKMLQEELCKNAITKSNEEWVIVDRNHFNQRFSTAISIRKVMFALFNHCEVFHQNWSAALQLPVQQIAIPKKKTLEVLLECLQLWDRQFLSFQRWKEIR